MPHRNPALSHGHSRRASLRLGLVAALLLVLAVSGCSRPAEPAPEPLTVFAAVSLTEELQQIAATHEARTGQTVRLSTGASGQVARQITAGAPADIVILADPIWMDRLETSGAVPAGGRRDLLRNRLVVIAPAEATVSDDPLAALVGGRGRLVIGDPESVPAGRYARDYLERRGLWERLQPRIVTALDVRAVRTFVERGEADLGIVYASDLVGAERVKQVAEPAAADQPDILYPAALTRSARPGAAALMAFIQGNEAQAIFVAHGFEPIL